MHVVDGVLSVHHLHYSDTDVHISPIEKRHPI